MRTHTIRLGLLLLCTAALTGCMISTQDGERMHVNSPHPEEIAFHFDSGYNQALLYGRFVVMLSAAGWFWKTRAGKGSAAAGVVLAAVVMIAAFALFWHDRAKLVGYRIEVRPTHLNIALPGEPERTVAWDTIEHLFVQGESTDIRIADGKGQALTEITRWEQARIVCFDGTSHALDLQPLSTEQRGNLWRAIVRKAALEAAPVSSNR